MIHTNLKGVLFFVGCGISKDIPSNLPLGEELTRAVINLSCGQKEGEAIIDVWKAASKQISSYDSNLRFLMPRLETICGCIYEIDRIMHRNSILNGFSSFSKIPYNYNHYILSEFLRNGADILTTNFDLGIENAYSNKYDDFTATYVDEISAFKTLCGGTLYHLHGSANDCIERLGATVERVKRGLSDEITERLVNKINDAEKIIFLGYGVTDTFDITPLLESEKIAGKNLVFIKHQKIDKSHNEKDDELPYYLCRIEKRFANSKVSARNTTAFLRDFAGEHSIYLDEEQKDGACFQWKEEFLRAMGGSYSDDEKLLNYLGIRYQLGFNPRIVEEKRPGIMSDIEQLKDNMISDNPRIMDYFHMALRDFDTPKEKQFTLPHKRVSEAVEFIDKFQIVAIRDECDYFLNKYRNTETAVEEEDWRRIDFLFDLLCIYSEFTYDKVQYISYIITCLKYKALFSARFKRSDPSDINYRELLLSLEISHFEGVVTALLHAIESTIIYHKITENSDTTKLEQLVKTAKAIANIIGCNYYKELIDQKLLMTS